MNLARSFSILVAVLGLAICTPLFVVAAQRTEPPPLVGEQWYRGDGLGYNITLVLASNGDYEARWDGCLGQYGLSRGHWIDQGAEVALEPEQEDGMMQGHLRTLRKIKLRGDTVLVPPEDVADVLKEARSAHLAAFRKVESIAF